MYDKHSGGVNMNAIELKGVTKTYDHFLLDQINLNVPKGYIMGFIGENGAGKTTTIKSMLNIIKKDKGDVAILGLNVDEHEIEIKKRIGFVSGDPFYPKRKLKQITNVYKRFYDSWDDNIYQKLIKEFHLIEDKKVDDLSKGMKIKYAIALALSHHAELIILDEPTSGLDPVARDNLLELFQSLVEDEEVTILFSTHITSDLEKCADYITFIQNGHIVESSTKDDLIDKYKLVAGSKKDKEKILDKLVASKENSLGFTGLIETKYVKEDQNLRYGQPSLDDIMIYYAEKGQNK